MLEKMKDPLYFIKYILRSSLWSKQSEVVRSVWENRRTTVLSSHSCGKSYLIGRLALAFLYIFRGSAVFITAPSFRQVEKVCFKEVRTAYAGASIPLGGEFLERQPLLRLPYKGTTDTAILYGFTGTSSDAVQGLHNPNLLFLVDEASGVSEACFQGIESILTSKNNKVVLLGNPISNSGTYYNSDKDKSYNKIIITAFDTPNFTSTGITIEDIRSGDWLYKQNDFIKKHGNLVSDALCVPEFVADKYARWGENSQLWKSRILAQFPTQSTDSLISIAWIELAFERYDEIRAKITNPNIHLGVDVSEYGGDDTVIAIKHENEKYRIITDLKVSDGGDLMQTSQMVAETFYTQNATSCSVDAIGVGSGLSSRLNQMGINVYGVKVSESSVERLDDVQNDVSYVNLRSQLYWYLRDALNPNTSLNPKPLALPRNEELMKELSEIRFFLTDKGKIQIESKKDLRKRLGRSPDLADAVALAVFPPELLKDEEEGFNFRLT